ncbi:MAG TPA: sigma factor, partial [Mucilaginibacter sp.]|nr:sigma factor [Mucilaginibacter sp.]
EQLAEELVMDLMLWVWNKRETLEVKGDLSSYLFRAIKNAIYNHFRKIELDTTSIDLVTVDPVAYGVLMTTLQPVKWRNNIS